MMAVALLPLTLTVLISVFLNAASCLGCKRRKPASRVASQDLPPIVFLAWSESRSQALPASLLATASL